MYCGLNVCAIILRLFPIVEKVPLTETRALLLSIVRAEKGGCWKEKMLDYEIETIFQNSSSPISRQSSISWKEKMLDYEIETSNMWKGKSLNNTLKRKDARLRDWNPKVTVNLDDYTQYRGWKEKMLDYEIETTRFHLFRFCDLVVEKKRCSITRLKHDIQPSAAIQPSASWKEKMLDYEIETIMMMLKTGQ